MTAIRAAALAVTAIAALAAAPAARATSVANPIAVQGGGRYALAAETEYVETNLFGNGIVSQRHVVKGIYRLNPWCDVFLRAGAGDIDVEGVAFGEPAEIDGTPKFAWGGGVRMHAWRSETLPFSPRLVLAVEGLVYRSESAIERTLTFPGSTLRQRHDAAYRWREIEGTATVVLRWRSFSPYGGWAFRRVEGDVRRSETEDNGTTATVVSASESDFATDLRAYPLAGVDYAAGETFHVSAQGFWRNEKDYGLFFGISETSR